ncbi:MAG: hypothetical protein ACFB0F_15245 [Neomegalonema sp.]
MKFRLVALTAFALGALATAASANGICDMTVEDTVWGERARPADGRFVRHDGRGSGQFRVCFEARANGYVSLWDELPLGRASAELLAPPNPNREGVRALKVTRGERACMGLGKADGYYLAMIKDLAGTGRLQLVYSRTAAGQGDGNRTIGASSVVNGLIASGAGAISAGRAGGWANDNPPDGINCKGHKRLTYEYTVE